MRPNPAVIQEIAVDDGSDLLTGISITGRFEKAAPPAPLPPSPADEAVKKVKRKLIQKSEQCQRTSCSTGSIDLFLSRKIPAPLFKECNALEKSRMDYLTLQGLRPAAHGARLR